MSFLWLSSGPFLFLRKPSYDRNGQYDNNYTHTIDSAWLYRALIRGQKFCKVPAVSPSMSLDREDERDYLVILRECRDSFVKYGLADKADAF